MIPGYKKKLFTLQSSIFKNFQNRRHFANSVELNNHFKQFCLKQLAPINYSIGLNLSKLHTICFIR